MKRVISISIIVLFLVMMFSVFAFAGVLKLTVASHVPPKYTDIFPLTQVFVDDVNTLGKGKVKLNYYHSGTLLGAKQLIPGLLSGTADIIFLTTSHCTGSWPIIGGESLPFLYKDVYDLERKFKIGSPLFNFTNEVLQKKHGIIMLANGVLPLECIWTNKPVRKPEDLKGMIIRAGGKTESEAIKLLGGSPVSMASAELYEALHRHTIDGVVAYPGTINGRSLHDVLKYCTKIPIGAYGYALWIKKDKWDSFPDDVKKIIKLAVVKYDYFFLQNAKNVEKKEFWPKFKKAGLEKIVPSQEDMVAFKNAVKPLWDLWVKQVGEDIGNKFIQLSTAEE